MESPYILVPIQKINKIKFLSKIKYIYEDKLTSLMLVTVSFRPTVRTELAQIRVNERE